MSNFLVTIHFAPFMDVPALKVGVSSGSYADLHGNIVDQLNGSQFLTLNDGEREMTAVRVRDIHRVTVEGSEPEITEASFSVEAADSQLAILHAERLAANARYMTAKAKLAGEKVAESGGAA